MLRTCYFWQVTEEMFSTWMRIMTDVTGSVLWMSRLAVSNETEARLRSAAASRGVSPDRLLPSKTKEIFGGLLRSETNSFLGFFGLRVWC